MLTKIIEKHMGCPGSGKAGGCYGPVGQYYTVFESELRFLTTHIIVSIFAGLILSVLLIILSKKNKINLPLYLIILISLIITILIFFISAYYFPYRVIY